MARDTMLFLPAKILEGLVGIFTLSYISHALTTGAVDSFGSINTIVSFSYLLLISWLTNSAARYVGDESKDDSRRISFFSTCSLIWIATNIFVYICGVGLSAIPSDVNKLTIFAVCFMFTANSVYQITLAMLVQVGKKRESISLSLISAVVKPTIIWLVCFIVSRSTQSDSAIPAVIAYVCAELLSGIAGVILLGIPKSFKLNSFSKKLTSTLLKYGVPLMGVSLSVGLLNFVDRFVIIFFGADFAVYYTNNTISSSVFTMLMVGIMRAVYPSILRSYREGGFKSAQSVLDNSVRIYLLVAMPAAAGLIGIGHKLSMLLFEESYVWGFYIIGLSAVAMFFTGLTEYAIKSWELRGDTKPIMQNALISMAVKVAATFVLLPSMGIFGAGISSIIAFALYFTISAVRSRKIFLFKLPLRRFLNIFIPSILCMLVAYIVSEAISSAFLAVAAAVIAGIAVYAVALTLSGEIKQELSAIRSKFAK